MKKEHRGLLIGMSIGDGHISIRKKDGKFIHQNLVISHGAKQEEYINYKADLLLSIFGGKRPNVIEFNNNGYKGFRFSKGNKYFRILKNKLYKNNKKVYSPTLLKQLTPHGIALWYMDDGTLAKLRNKNTKKIRTINVKLCTYVSKEQNEIIINYFKETYDIKFNLVYDKNKYLLRANKENSLKFIELVKPYIIKSMYYKIDV